MILFEDLTGVVLWLLTTIMTVNGLFLCFVFYHRMARKRYYAIKDSARERYQPVIAGFVAGQISVERAIELLAGGTSRPEQDAVEEMLLETVAVANANRERMSELLLGTGLLERWARQAFGRARGNYVLRCAVRGQAMSTDPRRFARIRAWVRRLRIFSVPRAIAVDHLGWLAPSFVRVFVAEALKDPAMEVRGTAVSVIGRNRDPQGIPLLVDELARSVEQNSDLSLRSVKLALVKYQRDDLPYFVAHLTHKLPRVRFFLVDAVSQICNRFLREESEKKPASSSRGSGLRHRSSSARMASSRGLMLNKNDFSREFYAVLIDGLVHDEFADVRARSAGVIRHFRDEATTEALRTLLSDGNEFVRLHAARACGDRSYAALTPELAKLLADPKWRVREAAAQSLRALGNEGIRELYKQFVATKDRYTSEQITDEIQRSGAIEDLAASLVSTNEYLPLAEAVCRKMVAMGKTSLLLNAMASPAVPSEARAFIMTAMAFAPPPEFFDVLAQIAEYDTGPLGMKASSLLGASGSTRAATGGASA